MIYLFFTYGEITFVFFTSIDKSVASKCVIIYFRDSQEVLLRVTNLENLSITIW